jgi:hypothetical protein
VSGSGPDASMGIYLFRTLFRPAPGGLERIIGFRVNAARFDEFPNLDDLFTRQAVLSVGKVDTVPL